MLLIAFCLVFIFPSNFSTCDMNVFIVDDALAFCYIWYSFVIHYMLFVIYDGVNHLQVIHHRPEIFKGQLDFGTMAVMEKRTMNFTLRNDNPVDVSCFESFI